MDRCKYFENVVLDSHFTEIKCFSKDNALDICAFIGGGIAKVESEIFSEIEAKKLVADVVYILFSERSYCAHQRLCDTALDIVENYYREPILVDSEGELFPINLIIDRCKYFEDILIEAHALEITYLHEGNAPDICAFLGGHIAKVESESGEMFSEIEAKKLVADVVYILFSERSYCAHQPLCDTALDIVENYRTFFFTDFGGLQTPCIVDEDSVQTKMNESKATIDAGAESGKDSKQLKIVFNTLNKKVNSLISRGDS